MTVARFLIVNADDFGQCAAVNRGIIKAHEHGIVTSASLMVRWPFAPEAAAYARAHPRLSLGLHVDLGEWAYRDGTWVAEYEVVPTEDAAAVRREVYAQLDTFRTVLGTDPTHLDSHQHVHLREPTRSVLCDIAAGLGVPLRHCSPQVRYCGDFYGQTTEGAPAPAVLSVGGLTRILSTLAPGSTELGCHPGEGPELEAMRTMYRHERALETQVLCDPRVRQAAVALGIELRSFADVTKGTHSTSERDSTGGTAVNERHRSTRRRNHGC